MSYTRFDTNNNIINLETLCSEFETTIKFTNESPIIRVMFGDLFKPFEKTKNNVFETTTDNIKGAYLCVPNFLGGYLKNIMTKMNGPDIYDIDPDQNISAHKVKSNLPDIINFVLFRYNDKISEWHNTFIDIGKALGSNIPEKSVLVIPTFGTNNNISFYDSALGIFTGLRYALMDSDSPFNKLREIRIVTPYNIDQINTSCRTIAQISNMINIYNKSLIRSSENRSSENRSCEISENLLCLLCTISPRNIILPCGHMILCEICERTLLEKNENCCIMCRKPYTQSYKCLPITDVSIACSDILDNHPRTGLTYVPCGHTNVLCTGCENDNIVYCDKCTTHIDAKLKVYVS